MEKTEKEKPCEEAYIKESLDSNDNTCSRYFIDLDTIAELDKLGKKYDVDVLVTEKMQQSKSCKGSALWIHSSCIDKVWGALRRGECNYLQCHIRSDN